MNDLIGYLNERNQELNQIIDILEAKDLKLPDDQLKVTKRHGKPYFMITETDPETQTKKERLLKKNEIDRAVQIAQTDYDRKALKAAKEQQKLVQKMLKNYNELAVREIFENLHEERKRLVVPVEMSDAEYIKRWEEMPYPSLDSKYEKPDIFSDKGEQMRSKSEKFIANKYYAMNVPYRYECPIKLWNGRRMVDVYTDFQLLHTRKREVFYHEHFGRMSDPSYANHAIEKIALYQKNGIYLGEKLIATFESLEHPYDGTDLEDMINRYLK